MGASIIDIEDFNKKTNRSFGADQLQTEKQPCAA